MSENMVTREESELFFRKVPKAHDDECWEWTAGKNDDGYGSFWHQKQTVGAHRVSYVIAHGEIPKGLVVMHSCDNPPCVNPKHLSLGTVADNNRDRHAKGRTVNPHSLKTHCKNGHEFSPENTRVCKEGARHCRTCTHLVSQRRPLKTGRRDRDSKLI